MYIGSDRPLIEDLYNISVSIAAKWKEIEVQLLPPGQNVDVMEAGNCSDPITCCKRVFDKWLEVGAYATWGQLIRALRDPSVNLTHYANHLEQMLLQQRFYGNVFYNSHNKVQYSLMVNNM